MTDTRPSFERTAAMLSAPVRSQLITSRRSRLMNPIFIDAGAELVTHGLVHVWGITDRGLAVRLHLLAEDDDGYALAGRVLGIGYADSSDADIAAATRALARICAQDTGQIGAAHVATLIDCDLVAYARGPDGRYPHFPALSSHGRERLGDLTADDLAGEAILRGRALTAEGER